MPYITPERREKIHIYNAGYPRTQSDPGEDTVSLIDVTKIDSAGELNFAFTVLIKEYFENNPRYQTCNDIVGALSNATDEFRRRIQHPYEDEKILENGDVY